MLDLMVNAISVMLYYTTMKSLIDEQTEISEQAGIFLEIHKRAGQNKRSRVEFLLKSNKRAGGKC